MNVELLRTMSQQQLFDFIIQHDIGNVVKHLMLYRTMKGYVLSVGELQERGAIMVSKFEFKNPEKIRNEIYKDCDIHISSFTRDKAVQIHEYLIYAYPLSLVFFNKSLMIQHDPIKKSQ